MGEPRLDGRVAVVTGAGRGIGRGCALALAGAGADVVLVSRSRDELEDAAAEARQLGARATVRPCDVTDAKSVHDAFDEIERVDVLVASAGGNRPQPFLDVTPAALDWGWQLNVRGTFLCSQAAARRMIAGGRGGAIVHLSSQMGHVGAPRRTVYCATKHAIEGLTKAMALELAPYGIRVNAVAPTFVETPMTAPFLEDPQFRDEALQRIPLGYFGQVDDVAAAVLFAVRSRLMTGASLRVDGGWTAQ